MNAVTLIVTFLFYSALAGLLGALAMTGTMRLIARTQWARGDMVIAVGSLLTKSKENALMVGVIMHGISAIGFGVIYTLILMGLHLNHWPMGFFAGVFFGVFHGLIVSLTLCWVVSDQHPLEEYRRVSVSVAVSHFIGHIVFGGVVGLVIAFAPLA
jgi:hypothetical protein